ncbi:hypothetical protein BCR44DRAFT_26912 [Catenaria anguillulae PL171]|uniref:Uncharacterized protein n=1 Tax=Catenaria anguillulae PL171 TaxID=765915 RepID=A0A1Y2I347_9FUNG|nr:hypothetical protein BCR44DRAFT_26912 [Catenaria anguillulae PL171]
MSAANVKTFRLPFEMIITIDSPQPLVPPPAATDPQTSDSQGVYHDFVVNVVPYSFEKFIKSIVATCSHPQQLQSPHSASKVLEYPYTFDNGTRVRQTIFFLVHLKDNFHPPIQVRATIPLKAMIHARSTKELVFYGLTEEAKARYFMPDHIELDRQARAARHPHTDSFTLQSPEHETDPNAVVPPDSSSSSELNGANQAAEDSGPLLVLGSTPGAAFTLHPIPYPPSSGASASRRRQGARSSPNQTDTSLSKSKSGARSPLSNEVRHSGGETDEDEFTPRSTKSRHRQPNPLQVSSPAKPKRAASSPKPAQNRRKPKAKAPEPSPKELVRKKMVQKAAAMTGSSASNSANKRDGRGSQSVKPRPGNNTDTASASSGSAADAHVRKPLFRRNTQTGTMAMLASSKRPNPLSPPRNATRARVQGSQSDVVSSVMSRSLPVSKSKRSSVGSVVKPGHQASRVATYATAMQFQVSQRPPVPTGPHSHDGVGLARRTLSHILGIASPDKQAAPLEPVASAISQTSTSSSSQQANSMPDSSHSPVTTVTKTTRAIESHDGSRPILIRTVSSPASLSNSSASQQVRLLGSSAQVADIRRVLHAKLGTLSQAKALELTKHLYERGLAKRDSSELDRQVLHYDPVGNALVLDASAMPADVTMAVWRFGQHKGLGW